MGTPRFLLATLTSNDFIENIITMKVLSFATLGLDSWPTSEAGESVNFKEKIPQALLLSEKGVEKKKCPESTQK